jgi:hemerythrin-like domain-containing protein
MKFIGPLMWEHRIIEKMVDVLRNEIKTITEKSDVNVVLIEQAVDFFRTYADRTHHGKEEDILFRDLSKKVLSPEHQTIVDELIEEHVTARKMVGELLEAKERYQYRRKFLHNLCTKAEVKPFMYHALRHYGASKLDNAGAPLTDIQEILGHQRATTTDLYLQSLKGSIQETIKKLEEP